MVIVKCYGTERKFESREAAIEEFWEGVVFSEGSERNRYINILTQLKAGKDYATDEE